MTEHKVERTLVLIKPDAFERGHVGEIISAIEDRGWNIVELQMHKYASGDLVAQHYAQHKKEEFYEGLCKSITGNKIIVMQVEGIDIIRLMRVLVGQRDVPGSLRGRFAKDIRNNAIHCSDSEEAAIREIGIWF
jgi:nucleoside-diphosphate kinase